MSRSEFVELLSVIHCFRAIADKYNTKIGCDQRTVERTKEEISPIILTLSKVVGFDKMRLIKMGSNGGSKHLFSWPVDADASKMSKSVIAKIKQFKFPTSNPVSLTYMGRSSGVCDYYFCRNGNPCVFVFTADENAKFDIELLERVLLFFDCLIAIFDVSASPNFTDRELEVVDLVVKGKTNNCISEILNISERTVKFHVSNIFQKLEIESRVELVGKVYDLHSRTNG